MPALKPYSNHQTCQMLNTLTLFNKLNHTIYIYVLTHKTPYHITLNKCLWKYLINTHKTLWKIQFRFFMNIQMKRDINHQYIGRLLLTKLEWHERLTLVIPMGFQYAQINTWWRIIRYKPHSPSDFLGVHALCRNVSIKCPDLLRYLLFDYFYRIPKPIQYESYDV